MRMVVLLAFSAVMMSRFSGVQTTSSTPAATQPVKKFASLRMLVVDPQKATIQKANITLLREGSQNKIEGIADSEGRATLFELPEGTYIISVSAQGFKMSRQTLHLDDQMITLTISLEPASYGDAFEAAPVLIPTDDSVKDPVITPYPIEPLPKKKETPLSDLPCFR